VFHGLYHCSLSGAGLVDLVGGVVWWGFVISYYFVADFYFGVVGGICQFYFVHPGCCVGLLCWVCASCVYFD